MTEYTKKTSPEDRLKYLETLEDGWYGFTCRSPNVALGVKPTAEVFQTCRSLLSLLPPNFNPGIFPYMDDGGLHLEWEVNRDGPRVGYMLTLNNNGTAEYFAIDHTVSPDELTECEWSCSNPNELAKFLTRESILENDT
jgi:hypothetical protein